MTYHQGNEFERVVATTSDADLAGALERLAADARAYSRAAAKAIYAEAARRLRWNGMGDVPAASPAAAPDRELTAEDRNRVADVLDVCLDELVDSIAVSGMYGPHAAIVQIALSGHPCEHPFSACSPVPGDCLCRCYDCWTRTA